MKSTKFKIEELVPLRLINLIHKDLLWKLIDDDLILAIDKIKKVFPKGSISINTYKWAGDRTQSCVRTKNSKYYSSTSQHSLGKAVDCIFSAYTTDEVRDYILNSPDEFPTIGGVELGTSWLHIDVRPRRNGKIITFTP
jgi:uncharacterized protein YcbK (DUF882 family)